MNEYAGKRLLVLGGTAHHLKVVRAAREMGVYTIVTDYRSVEDSPCKQIADKSYQLDIMDIDGIVKMCREERVDGVLGAWVDVCQEPYYEICHRLGLPCYIDTREQLTCLTDKEAFKACCKKYGVDIIPGYEPEDLFAEDAVERVKLPVIVKPARNCGSQGCTVCHTLEEAREAVDRAREVSQNSRVIVEQYMHGADMISFTIFMVEGQPYLFHVSDGYFGPEEAGIDRVYVAVNIPSKHIHTAGFRNCCRLVKEMLKGLGIVNGPVFLQGFVDGNKVRLFDPGFRFAGSNSDLVIKYTTGFDLAKTMIEFALTGRFSERYGKIDGSSALLNGYVYSFVAPAVRAGRIAEIRGVEEIVALPEIIEYVAQHKVGDVIRSSNTVRQRTGEFRIVSASPARCREIAKKVMGTYRVLDDNGEDMVISSIDAVNWEWGQDEKRC